MVISNNMLKKNLNIATIDKELFKIQFVNDNKITIVKTECKIKLAWRDSNFKNLRIFLGLLLVLRSITRFKFVSLQKMLY